jgi:hypothetical protein
MSLSRCHMRALHNPSLRAKRGSLLKQATSMRARREIAASPTAPRNDGAVGAAPRNDGAVGAPPHK